VVFHAVIMILSIIAGVFVTLIWWVGVGIKYERRPDDDDGVQGAIAMYILVVA